MKKIDRTFSKHGFGFARMIGGSKTLYRDAHPGDDILFNANIFSDKEKKKVWYGDLNITKDAEALQAVADELEDRLYIVPEMYGRFGAEERDFEKITNDAYAYFDHGFRHYFKRDYSDNIVITKIDNMNIAHNERDGWTKIDL